jgi:hypothetical protein
MEMDFLVSGFSMKTPDQCLKKTSIRKAKSTSLSQLLSCSEMWVSLQKSTFTPEPSSFAFAIEWQPQPQDKLCRFP